LKIAKLIILIDHINCELITLNQLKILLASRRLLRADYVSSIENLVNITYTYTTCDGGGETSSKGEKKFKMIV